MKRKAILVDYSKHQTTHILVDEQNASIIIPYIHRDGVIDEFKEIRNLLKENLRNREKYCKADVSGKADSIFEMRFTRQDRNDRIYCKELRQNKRRLIIMVELFEGKKSQSIPKQIKSRIETMGRYEYEFKY